MLFTMKKFIQCLYTPRLYNVHRNGPLGGGCRRRQFLPPSLGQLIWENCTDNPPSETHYQPSKMEAYADIVINVATAIRSMAFYMSPFISIYLYKRGFFTEEETQSMIKLVTGLGCVISMAFIVRSFARVRNSQYVSFLNALTNNKEDLQSYYNSLKRFDFEFEAWPATYVIPYNPDSPCWDRSRPFVTKENEHLPFYKKCIVKVLAYIAVHTFALRLIYPGSIGLVHSMLHKALVQGRASLIEEHGGQRVKVIAADGNAIDTMFVDNRCKSQPNGNTLVVCSEGNSGFYEIGIMTTPLKAGYSALGWNHPGFAGSTGLPYPRQEHCAIDAIMQYAIQSLKFQPDQIVMFGWSIGGYSAAWAACNYHTKALMLDATFDDLIYLAVNQMPASWEPLVREVIRGHVDLNVAEMTKHYRGPLHFIRRTDDEIICLTPGDIATNRGNHLLLKVVSHRHSEDVDQLLEILIRFTMMPEARRPKLADPVIDASMKSILRLILRYSSDYKSSHCTPLPTGKFEGILNYILETQRFIVD